MLTRERKKRRSLHKILKRLSDSLNRKISWYLIHVLYVRTYIHSHYLNWSVFRHHSDSVCKCCYFCCCVRLCRYDNMYFPRTGLRYCFRSQEHTLLMPPPPQKFNFIKKTHLFYLLHNNIYGKCDNEKKLEI